ncbi:uncharacterized protein LOC141631680 [Silene latifolia]|uniref:uncharacterized protein LOC141631680 n=1 Tax=Silene latifolia TaxID=37657 RepID=UPI003D779713
MKIFSWNCRGLGGADAPIVPYKKWSVRYYDISLVFLQETKCSLADSVCKTSSLNLPNSCGTNSAGLSGGLLLLWDDRSDVVPLVVDQHFILCKTVDHNLSFVRFALFMYGESCSELKASFWKEMKQLCSAYSPLCMIGDFNQIEQYSDKIGGSSSITGWNDFVDWRINSPLCELPFSGPRFTWANKRESSSLILERLDRGYATQDWLLKYPEAHIQNLFIFLSDHAPIILDFSARLTKPKRPYRVDIWCLNHSDIQNLVLSIWQSFSSDPVTSSVTYKLSQIRTGILNWVIQNRHQFMLDWSSFSQDLYASASHIHDSNSASQYLQNLRISEHEVHAQHSFWQQRAKSDFHLNDGLPTSFFFSRAKARQKNLRIISLKHNDGSWTSSESALSDLIMNHFQNLFTSSLPSTSFSELEDLSFPQLDVLQQDYLSQPFTASDVKKAFFDMKPNKSPGPDGFPPRFYQLFWHTVNVDITSAVLRFLNDGHLPPAWNNTHIVLIPKVVNPESISQFRPISLCNVIYRAASKCIALRLRKVTNNIIGQNQNAFLPGRLISDTGFLGHGIISYINQRRSGTRCFGAIKLDMNKAFDRVSWPFLFHVLKLFGFPKVFRKLIKACVKIVSLQVLINGTPSRRIFPQCDLSQGDPISPYLFILCMDILSLMIIKAESNRSIEGIKLSRNSPAISHLLYADDALLCFRLSPSACESLRDILISFSAFSGQMINHQKSYIKFSPNTPDDFRDHVTNILRVPSKQNFGNYLGVPIDIGRRKTAAFQFILDKISSKILSWGAAHFSQLAKLLLINTILIASFSHVASILPIPLQITTKINYLINLFWWKQSQNKRAQHWLSSDILQLPKTEGGLGMKNARIVSQALLSMTFWRCHHQHASLISTVLRPKYQKDFPIPEKVSKYSAASFAWKGVVKNTFLLRDGFAWKFGNRNLINIKNDAWILGTTPSLKSMFKSHSIRFADLLSGSTQWNKQNVFKFFNTVSARKICALELPPEPMDDFVYWKFTEDGRYSTSSGYSFLLHKCSTALTSHQSPATRDFKWSFIWSLPCQPNIKIFLWKIVHGILPTADVLIRRGMAVYPNFSFCHEEPESINHLFRDCQFVKRIWAASLLGIRSDDASSHISFSTWFQNFLRYTTRPSDGNALILLHFPLTMFAIWKHRNNVIFRNSCVCPDEIIAETARLSQQQFDFISHFKCYDSTTYLTEVITPVTYIPQRFSYYFRTEVVFNKNFSIGSFKVFCNDHVTYEALQCFGSPLFQNNILALNEAMTFASVFRLQAVLFQIHIIQLLRLMQDSSSSSFPVALSSSISRLKFFLSYNVTWYCNGIV